VPGVVHDRVDSPVPPEGGVHQPVNRKRDGPERFLANYRGYLHADAFSGYDGLYLPDPRTAAARITEVACNAHARRKFCEARGSDALRSHQALAYYRQLDELERQARDFDLLPDHWQTARRAQHGNPVGARDRDQDPFC
jgi:hypothetical protein